MDVLYSQCWEDYNVLIDSLEPNQGDTILSIGSGGENSFALLLHNPKKLVVLDNNPAQLSVIKIKAAGIQALNFDEFLKYTGFIKTNHISMLHSKVEKFLEQEEVSFVSKHPEIFKYGISHIGKFEDYLRKFRSLILPFVLSKSEIEEYLSLDDTKSQSEFYDQKWDDGIWRALFSVFFSKCSMSFLGRKKEYFTHNKIRDIASYYRERAKHGITEIKAHSNPFMHQILTGTIPTPFEGHPYLDKKNFSILKELVSNIEYVENDLKSYLNCSQTVFNKCNLSDVFEPMSHQEYEGILIKLTNIMPQNSVICYWNNLVDRSSHNLTKMFRDEALSKKLSLEDKVFFYSRFIVERINK